VARLRQRRIIAWVAMGVKVKSRVAGCAICAVDLFRMDDLHVVVFTRVCSGGTLRSSCWGAEAPCPRRRASEGVGCCLSQKTVALWVAGSGPEIALRTRSLDLGGEVLLTSSLLNMSRLFRGHVAIPPLAG